MKLCEVRSFVIVDQSTVLMMLRSQDKENLQTKSIIIRLKPQHAHQQLLWQRSATSQPSRMQLACAVVIYIDLPGKRSEVVSEMTQSKMSAKLCKKITHIMANLLSGIDSPVLVVVWCPKVA